MGEKIYLNSFRKMVFKHVEVEGISMEINTLASTSLFMVIFLLQ